MATKFSFGTIEFDVSLGSAAGGGRRDPDASFCLAVLGDFSGRSSRGISEPIGQRRIWAIDCDSFEETMGRLGSRLRLSLSRELGQATDLRFNQVDDFHPDQLFRQVGSIGALLEQRRRLRHPSTATAAASELQALLASVPTSVPPQSPTPPTSEADADTLARLLGAAPQRPPPTNPDQTDAALNRLIQNIVAPSIVPGAMPQQTALLSVLDLELTARLRSILHHAEFQALEAAWRGLDLLARRFGAEENLKLFLLDVSKDELAADLKAHDHLEESGICKLTQRQQEDQPWAVWLGLFTFGDTLSDIEMLGRLAKVSARTGAPFLAGASPRLVGCDSFAVHPDPEDWKLPLLPEVREAWQALRQLQEAAYLGLALPRFLLRQPYGKESDPIEAFPFDELPAHSPHESYLWGNPAVVCGYLLAQAFLAEGWEMRASGYGELGDLPVHTFQAEGETNTKACAEAWLSERVAETIRQSGLMPLLSIKGRDSVRLAGMRSLRSPGGPLSGRWKP